MHNVCLLKDYVLHTATDFLKNTSNLVLSMPEIAKNIFSSVGIFARKYTFILGCRIFYKCDFMQEKAAIVVQNAFRNHLLKKRLKNLTKPHFIPTSCLAHKYIKTDEFKLSKRAKVAGRSEVYFPEQHPEIIIKKPFEKPYYRLNKMIKGRDLCTEKGYDRLAVPKASAHYEDTRSTDITKIDYLIEDRLPIISGQDFYQTQLYANTIEGFSSAVEQYTNFVFLTSPNDLELVQSRHIAPSSSQEFCYFNSPRYDNMPLFVESDGKCKIGLVDLEDVSFKPSNSPDYLKMLIFSFPHHADIIKKEAAKYVDPSFFESEENNKELDRIKQEGIKRIDILHVGLTEYHQRHPNINVVPTPEMEMTIVNNLAEKYGFNNEEKTKAQEFLRKLSQKLQEMLQESIDEKGIEKVRPFVFLPLYDLDLVAEKYQNTTMVNKIYNKASKEEDPAIGCGYEFYQAFIREMQKSDLIYQYAKRGFSFSIMA